MPFGMNHGKAARLETDELKTATFDDFSAPISEETMFRNLPEQECTMCGDVGFSAELFQCSKCLHRLQHTYCSIGYPNITSKELICDWCYSEESKLANDKLRSKRKMRRTEIDWHQYKDALDFLLDVAQQAGDGEHTVGEQVQNQVNCNKATTLNQPETKRNRCGIKENDRRSPEKWKSVTKKKLRLSAPTKGIGGRRYKLLSDVLC
ncbi:hypothetical protein O6H91_16G070800 [Diphasiastrum complanatum]|uniref:Uncharacterized protein n=1 Tax=Diphasiastrum complanatum TaxID=34168 RepID=A0ACC2BDA9_DIPCM|nr:hypothetical protein O6H91_16G070800 [Diphasiastrum complanatum]